MKKIFISLIVAISIVASFSVTVSAETTTVPYSSYEYNSFGESVPTPATYYQKNFLDSTYLGLELGFKEITDMVVSNDIIYVLDSGNSRIVAIDKSYKVIKIYSKFKVGDKNREKLVGILGEDVVYFNGARGFTVSPDGKFYIADTTGNRVLCVNKDGFIENVILRPDEALNNTGASFSPKKVEVDDENKIYITSENIALGVMIFNEDGSFIQFYGANEVLSTTQALVKAFRKLFMNLTQLEQVEQATPVTISAMDFSEDGFLYTVSPYRDSANQKAAVPGLVSKLNYKGNDIISSEVIFGDLEEHDTDKTWFYDVEIDDSGFINLLDGHRGRVFQYDDTGMLISVFGAKGDQVGCFSAPSSLETFGENVLVADSKKNCIFVFSLTEYTKVLRRAVINMNNNNLEDSQKDFEALSKMNSNSYFAYNGMGRIYDYKGDYKTAMKYFKLADNQEDYALAYQQLREQALEKYSLLIVGIVVLFFLAFALGIKALKRFAIANGPTAYSKMEQKYTMPFYILLHPIDGCAQFKRRNIASMRFSAGVILLWVIVKVLGYNFTGFSFSINRSVDFNMMVELVLTLGVFIAFVTANWFIAVLLEGKGRLKDIIATVAYGLIPYVITQGIKIALTNVLVPSESVLISIVTTIGLLWSATAIIVGLMTIHEYSVGQTIWSLFLTLVGIVIFVFLIILMYSLVQQSASFFKSIYEEYLFRT